MGARWKATEGAMHPIVRRAAAALEGEPSVLASALAAYRHRHGLDETALAAWLGLAPERLPALALCHRPDPTAPQFAVVVAGIAQYVGCDTARLTALLTSCFDDPPAT